MPYKNKEQAIARSKNYYQANKQKIKDYQKQYRVKNKKYGRDATEEYFWHKYGITLEDYDDLLQEQEFKCGVCKRHVSELSQPLFVDHDHTTGVVRGLLCIRCNTSIGGLGDSIDGLLAAIEYLRKAQIC